MVVVDNRELLEVLMQHCVYVSQALNEVVTREYTIHLHKVRWIHCLLELVGWVDCWMHDG